MKFTQCKGNRIYRTWFMMEVTRDDELLWFEKYSNTWYDNKDWLELPKYLVSIAKDIKSVKAAKRIARKHLKEGDIVNLISRYRGYDIEFKVKKKRRK